MCQKAIILAAALSFMLLFPPSVVSQDTNGSNRTRETRTSRRIHGPIEGIGPAVHDDRRALEEDASIAGFRELKEGLGEFKEAQQFMQLKAALYTDLNRPEKSKHAIPSCDTARGPNPNCQNSGNLAVSRTNGSSFGEPPAPAKREVLPMTLMPAGRTKTSTQSRQSGAHRDPSHRLPLASPALVPRR